MLELQLEPTFFISCCCCFSLCFWIILKCESFPGSQGGGEATRFHQQRLDDATAELARTSSDVDVSHVRRGAGQVCGAGRAFGFRGAAVVLGLLQAGLQEGLDLLLTRPQAVLQNRRFKVSARGKTASR